MKISLNNLRNKSFAIYGLGITGRSIIKFFNKNGIKNYNIWDDNNKVKKKYFGKKIKKKRKEFINSIQSSDFILVSPGINIKNSKMRNILEKNKEKIITDLDLFYLSNPFIRSIVVTGTNGKSTTCKILEHILKKNNFNTGIGGNIGNPILNSKIKRKSLMVIEASSFQLAYSKFIKPNYALLLNITKDHLDWHGSMKNYINSKFKIFRLQNKNNFALINSESFIRNFKKNKYLSIIKFVKIKEYKKIKNEIKNDYLNLEANDENMSFIYTLSKILKIKKNSFIKSLSSFKGLSHRYEIFYKRNKKTFINDSKATTFEATKFALRNRNNIFWIVGGLPKKGDRIRISKLKKNIVKAYIIGKNKKHFAKYLDKKVDFLLAGNLKKALLSISGDIKKYSKKENTILLSPASASYDQFRNFEDRGNQFKKLVKKYARKFV